MALYFCLTFRFLDPTFHGRADGGNCEWPPSPLRAFQSLVAAAARRRGGTLDRNSREALQWLEAQPPPTILAPSAVEGSGFCLSVPNNSMDIVAKAWCRGNYSNSGDSSPATHRTMKPVRPRLLSDGAVRFIWALPDSPSDEIRGHIQTLSWAARSVVALGWGIDMAVGHSSTLSAAEVWSLKGERWLPTGDVDNGGLRAPIKGTLDNLTLRHQGFLTRIRPDGFVPPPALSAYQAVSYRRAAHSPGRPIAAFSLLRPDASGFRPFDAARRALTVAGMMRCAAKLAAQRSGGTWTDDKIDAFILGHGAGCGGAQHDGRHVPVGPERFSYLPLPTIEWRGGHRARVVGSIRRVALCCFAHGRKEEIAWARRTLSGRDLVDGRTQQPAAMLSLIPESDRVVRCYTEAASDWATVTPVVLPGYDDPEHLRRRARNGSLSQEQNRRILDHLSKRIEGLLRKAIVQAGFSQELADHAQIDWRKAGFWPGTELAERYGVPDHLRRFPRLHVRIQWRDAHGEPVDVPGPICVGGGRFYGVGLFAAWPGGKLLLYG